MAWVRSEYAGEFAVLSAWLAMVLPWNVVYYPNAPLDSTVVFVRFSVIELQIRFPVVLAVGEQLVTAANALAAQYPGTQLVSGLFVASPIGSIGHYDGAMRLGSIAWAIGALVLVGAFAFSLAFYLREEAVTERSPVDPARVIGWALAAATVATAIASALYFLEQDLAGVPVPIGTLIMGALAAAVLRAEHR
ncbi:DUF7549 family protein [Halapricum desulfuricans]|uniref:Membrane protein, associated with type IV pili like system n=1 Tax=Halapricum desulfuricans TaxID=2841257 RepID=A0A897N9B9_9EURY|nr:hypothetical protein [Halapricum desulfuricans]QSG07885.1 Membrane protein, associated with type IV pili like system [Halapricum desulfuricans]